MVLVRLLACSGSNRPADSSARTLASVGNSAADNNHSLTAACDDIDPDALATDTRLLAVATP
jgi:hypothetical protein